MNRSTAHVALLSDLPSASPAPPSPSPPPMDTWTPRLTRWAQLVVLFAPLAYLMGHAYRDAYVRALGLLDTDFPLSSGEYIYTGLKALLS